MKHLRLFAMSGTLAMSSALLASAGAGSAAAPQIVHATAIGLVRHPAGSRGVRNTWEASNWSGYAETGTFTGVSGTWTVPAVAPSSSPTFSSTWTGVDGFDDSDLIQTGTEQDYFNGSAHYDAWWEILPAAETEISTSSFPVSPGDRISATIYETSATTTVRGSGGRRVTEHEWVIQLSDTTKGWTFTTTQAYGGPGSSAEWIEEAPEVNGSISTLAQYSITAPSNEGDFDNASVAKTVTAAGATPALTGAALNFANDSGVMIQDNVQVSTPGDPDSAETAFNIAHGSAVPATPSS